MTVMAQYFMHMEKSNFVKFMQVHISKCLSFNDFKLVEKKLFTENRFIHSM